MQQSGGNTTIGVSDLQMQNPLQLTTGQLNVSDLQVAEEPVQLYGLNNDEQTGRGGLMEQFAPSSANFGVIRMQQSGGSSTTGVSDLRMQSPFQLTTGAAGLLNVLDYGVEDPLHTGVNAVYNNMNTVQPIVIGGNTGVFPGSGVTSILETQHMSSSTMPTTAQPTAEPTTSVQRGNRCQPKDNH